MFVYLIRRLNLLITTLFLISLFSFSLGHFFPGDPVINFSGQQSLDYDEYEALSQTLGMNQSYFEQYIIYLRRILDGDLGLSFSTQTPLIDDVIRVMPASIELSFYALLLTLVLGLPLGLWAGIKQHKLVDKIIFTLATMANSVPIFWSGLIFILIFSLNNQIFPMSGRLNLLYEVPSQTGFLLMDIFLADMPNKLAVYQDALTHLVLPTLTLAILPTTLLIGMMRSSVVNVMRSPYIKAALTKGLSTRELISRHVFRNAIVPIIPQFSLLFNILMTSTMITEIIFSWPGIGHWLIEAIYQRDYPAIQATLLLVASIMIMITVVLDILHMLVNPLARQTLHAK
ncbi:ABC transporter permease subunit [Catenovulum maritimum]|uniref:Peptide ABC transporter permease n=1 Tax=Catenovulum maritimum TaxID=1513271 RepID=A0A0J8GRQ6_9ALTE|nr:ABC transporter permease subunit [Catenovulum maritimum]KMT65402.1 peptide ABC transporter permease [Catenovulum maritimum]